MAQGSGGDKPVSFDRFAEVYMHAEQFRGFIGRAVLQSAVNSRQTP